MTTPEQEPRRVFNVKAVIAVGFCFTYLGVLVWAVVTDRLDVLSFMTGLGPSVGLLIKDWFSASS